MSTLSESVEMYLLRIALLSQEKTPVPISQLAETLQVSPISANQMCRRLEDRGLVVYQPYRGVSLTPQGEAIAQTVLRKRRLWKTFLSDLLGLAPEEADTMACRLEHVTPDDLADRLDRFLQHPCPEVPSSIVSQTAPSSAGPHYQPLSALGAGEHARVHRIALEGIVRDFLRGQGFVPGAEVHILATAPDKALLVQIQNRPLSLAIRLAQHIQVEVSP